MAKGLQDAGFGAAEVSVRAADLAVAQVGREDIASPCTIGGVRVFADARIDARAELIAAIGDPELGAESADEALILAAWRKWGEDCPRHLLGDYAFVIHDTHRGMLFCARDHAGARPFFYSAAPERFAFASDPNPLLALPDLDPGFDEDVVLTSLASRHYFPFDRTWFRGIAKLAPGHRMRVTRDHLHIDRYWRPGNVEPVRLARAEDYAAQLRALVEAAVADRLRGARRVGLHISGGLDSTAVAAIALSRLRSEVAPEPVGFCWHGQDRAAAPATEPGWSEAARAHLGIELVAPLPTAGQLADLIRRDVTRNPDPGNLMNEAAVQHAAAERGVDVILSGWGGDQGASFVGRGYATDLFVRGRWLALWRSAGRVGIPARLRRFLGAARQAVGERTRRFDSRPGGFPSDRLRRRARMLPIPLVRKTSAARTMHDLFEKGPIQSRLETWAASGARLGIEYRYPLLDRRVLEFCYAIPPEIFSHTGVGRWLMRTAMADLLPAVVARHAGKKEPHRLAEMTPPLLEALARLAGEIDRHRGAFAREEYVDVAKLSRWLATPREAATGQWHARLALQFLDFPVTQEGPAATGLGE